LILNTWIDRILDYRQLRALAELTCAGSPHFSATPAAAAAGATGNDWLILQDVVLRPPGEARAVPTGQP